MSRHFRGRGCRKRKRMHWEKRTRRTSGQKRQTKEINNNRDSGYGRDILVVCGAFRADAGPGLVVVEYAGVYFRGFRPVVGSGLQVVPRAGAPCVCRVVAHHLYGLSHLECGRYLLAAQFDLARFRGGGSAQCRLCNRGNDGRFLGGPPTGFPAGDDLLGRAVDFVREAAQRVGSGLAAAHLGQRFCPLCRLCAVV